jgi:archaellum component FlaF (FlaF/FlaG flagellin family)
VKLLQQFEGMTSRVQAIIVISVALVFGGALAVVIVATDSNYTRDQAVSDANYYCAEHGGVERFDYTYQSDGKSQVICKDGALAVFP